MPLQRLLTALVLVGLFLPSLYFLPSSGWLAVCILLVGIAAQEWARLSGIKNAAGCIAFAVLVGVSTSLISLVPWLQFGWFAAAALFWVAIAPWLLYRTTFPRASLLSLAAGLVILTAAGGAMVALRNVSPSLLLALMAIIWISDSSAYFSGRRFGRNKLAPKVSPGKTWEGVAGAMLMVLAYATALTVFLPNIVMPKWLPPSEAHYGLIAFWLFLAALGIVGDLIESLLKRSAGVKDSGNILPGHGGMLDRIDALLPMLPLAALFYLR
jgi:phosphatidate cytidylyltransferase